MANIDHPIIGFRSFVPSATQDGQVRSRFTFHYEWQPGINSAECRQSVHRVGDQRIENDDHDRITDTVPSTECTCGFYAHHTYEDSLNYMATGTFATIRPQTVFAIVKGWGRIQVHSDGFRSQYMEILAIVPGVDPEYDRKAANYYGVPYLTGDVEIMASEFGKRAPMESRPTEEDIKNGFLNQTTVSTTMVLSDAEQLIVLAFGLAYVTGAAITLRVASLIAGKVMKHVFS